MSAKNVEHIIDDREWRESHKIGTWGSDSSRACNWTVSRNNVRVCKSIQHYQEIRVFLEADIFDETFLFNKNYRNDGVSTSVLPVKVIVGLENLIDASYCALYSTILTDDVESRPRIGFNCIEDQFTVLNEHGADFTRFGDALMSWLCSTSKGESRWHIPDKKSIIEKKG